MICQSPPDSFYLARRAGLVGEHIVHDAKSTSFNCGHRSTFKFSASESVTSLLPESSMSLHTFVNTRVVGAEDELDCRNEQRYAQSALVTSSVLESSSHDSVILLTNHNR